MKRASALYRLLGDEARLRLLRLLARERLNVTELTGIMGLAQSGVSRHLGLLKDAGLVVEEKDAGFTYYRAAPPDPSDAGLWPMLDAQFQAADADTTVRADAARLQEVLRLRQENFETRSKANRQAWRQLVPGRSWAAWSRALGLLLPPLKVADLGCGEGYLTIEAARWASRVIAVDRSEVVLQRARVVRSAVVSRTSSGRRASSKSCPCAMRPSTSHSCRRRSITPGSRPLRSRKPPA